ncbi:hypothetical protein SAMN05216244_2804 [Sediminibacillus halophilus]|uniref:Uncharacterized protein n=1 Tax=Sediminibacillus halophilus TaxID=482461 RepID=A0A1G9U0Z6_9BACI|nr:hypothetical protein SAMN05216244_2804 [Sediminibacillus halophilus]
MVLGSGIGVRPHRKLRYQINEYRYLWGLTPYGVSLNYSPNGDTPCTIKTPPLRVLIDNHAFVSRFGVRPLNQQLM